MRAGRRGGTRSASTSSPTGFGLWAEQLLAESTGKQGKGLVPAPGEPPDGPDRQRGELDLVRPYDLGGELYRWEFATAVAGHVLGINPFDQPDVQAAKDKTNEVLAARRAGRRSARLARRAARAGAGGSRLRLHPGVHRPGPRGRAGAARRARARDRLRRHEGSRPALPALDRPAAQGRPGHRASSSRSSTTPGDELPIPGRDFGFGRLIRSQAAGDFAALEERGRRVDPHPTGGHLRCSWEWWASAGWARG